MTEEREQLRQEVIDSLANEGNIQCSEVRSWESYADAVMSAVDRVVAERDRLRTELESFVEASLEECDYTSDGESGGWEPDDYERAKANIAEMHRVLLVRLERLFQTQDRAAAERESRFRWAEEAARLEAELETRFTTVVHQCCEDLQTLRASAVVLPDDWREQVTAYTERNFLNTETGNGFAALIESWRVGAQTPEPTPSDLQVPPSLGATDVQ